ncbi:MULTISPECIES: hypothetical protein [Bacillus]|uniref:hypothetical protein n=1 Tax=Bacillus TaxID=1386 RepID=UPI0002F45775|nr:MULTISPECIES: hypothetical protein [Bacillus]
MTNHSKKIAIIGVTGASLDIEGDRKSLVYRIGALLFHLLYPQMIADKKKELQYYHAADWIGRLSAFLL